MNPLDLAYINRLAPYKVWTENGCDYLVETGSHLLFRVGFIDDYSIWPTGTYQFFIINESHRPSPNDEKLKATVFRITPPHFLDFIVKPNCCDAAVRLCRAHLLLRRTMLLQWLAACAYKHNSQ